MELSPCTGEGLSHPPMKEDFDMDSPEPRAKTVLDSILTPVMPMIKAVGDRMPSDAKRYTLSFVPFTVNLLYAIIFFSKFQTHVERAASLLSGSRGD